MQSRQATLTKTLWCQARKGDSWTMLGNPNPALQSPATLALIPALELIFWPRLTDQEKQLWSAKWGAAGGRIYGGRMIALKNAPVWRAMTGAKYLTGEAEKKDCFMTRGIRKPEAVALGLMELDEELLIDAFSSDCPPTLLRPMKKPR